MSGETGRDRRESACARGGVDCAITREKEGVEGILTFEEASDLRARCANRCSYDVGAPLVGPDSENCIPASLGSTTPCGRGRCPDPQLLSAAHEEPELIGTGGKCAPN